MTPATAKLIELSITVKATPERVYQALTDARELERWFPSMVETDPRVGGKYAFTWLSEGDGDGHGDHTRSGEFVELIPGKKVSYTWDAGAMKFGAGAQGKALMTLVEFLIDAVEGGTKITLRHSGWGEGTDWADLFDGHSKGWAGFLANYKSVTEQGIDNRATEFKMRTK